MAIFDYQPMQPNTSASFYDIAYRRPREMTREDLGSFDEFSEEWLQDAYGPCQVNFWLLDGTDAPYAFWLGAAA